MDAAEPLLHVVLFQPEIPPNTGNAGRLCLGVGARLHVVHPIPFSMDAKQVRRAGLDYWKHVDLQEHADPKAFWSWVDGRPVYGFSTRGTRAVGSVPFERGAILVFGCETRGLPEAELARTEPVTIPMTGPVRSLNLSNAVAVAVYTALQRIEPTIYGAKARPGAEVDV